MKYILCMLLILSFSISNAQDTGASPSAAEQVTEKANDTSDKVLTEAAPASTVDFGDITGTQKYKYTCTSGADVREITVITQADNSVGVVYKKSDSTKTIALAKNDPSYADLKAEKVKGNLEAAGYTCTKE